MSRRVLSTEGNISSILQIIMTLSIDKTLPKSSPEALRCQHAGAPNDNFRKNICSEDDLRARIFGTFVVKFLACLLLLGFSNI